MSSSPPEAQIDLYLDGTEQLRRSVAGLTHDHIRARPIVGKWSTLEVVCHLVDSEQAWCHRFKRVIAENRPLIIGYDQSLFTASLGYHDNELDDELMLFDCMRRQMGGILRRLPKAAWSRTCIHSERGLMTLDEMLQAEIEHISHHVKHIQDKRRALGLPDGK
jgi:uncharacterized damage-inducible protein DinB